MTGTLSVRKPGRKWLWAAVIAVVMLSLLAFAFREQTPFEFLSGASRLWTHIVPYPTRHDDSALTAYSSDLSIAELEGMARKELLPKGWYELDGRFVSPGGLAETFRVYSGDVWEAAEERGVYGKTVIVIHRPATAHDRCLAFLDSLRGR